MRKIHMVDLQGQYQKIKQEVQTEIENVLNTATFINGPAVKDFEADLQEYLSVTNVIGCANGTDALQISLMALDLKRGDEVITTNFTFAATVEVILLLGLKPVLVDIDPITFNMDIERLRQAISKKTRVILPVHLFGQVCPMEPIMDLARENNLFVLEDSAQSTGASYRFSDETKKRAGSIGHLGTTSFFPSKNLGCYGDGGAIFTDDSNLASKIRGLVNHGMYQRYYHDIIGVNSRLDSIQAAVLKVKLPYLDAYIQNRRRSAEKYSSLLKGCKNLILPKFPNEEGLHVWHQYTIRVLDSRRDQLVDHLNANNVPCGIYYPVPLHRQKAYQSREMTDEQFPVTCRLSKEVLSLPMHTELDEQQLEFIANLILDFQSR